MTMISQSDSTIRLVVVDDHPLFRSGIVAAISAAEGMLVVGECDDTESAVAEVLMKLPDVVILDINIPGGGGIEAARRISECCPAVKIMMLTVSEEEEHLHEAFRVGARSYVLKGISGTDLVQTIRSVKAGEVYVTPSLASRMLMDMSVTESDQSRLGLVSLTDREHEILAQVASGNPNKEIAYNLAISEKTVKHYMTNILEKLQARNRVEAAIIAHDAGLGEVEPGGRLGS